MEKITYNFIGDLMQRSFIINYAKNLTKEDVYNFVKSNNINISNEDIDTIYKHIKKDYNVFFDDPIKYIKMLKGNINDDIYYQILMIYDKYKDKI